MDSIIYRHYEPGDEEGCAKLFIKSFQTGNFSHIYTPSFWHWRYPCDPDFEPEMIQIAEDIDRKRIVGLNCANRIEKAIINGNEYLLGEINDICVDPLYMRKGIGLKLMEVALDYFKSRDCDFSALTSAPDSFQTEKLYSKLGYAIIDTNIYVIGFPYPFKLIKQIPATFGLLPIFFTMNHFSRFLNRLRIKYTDFFKDFSYEIVRNKKHWEVMDAINRIFPNYNEGFYPYAKKQYRWMRIEVPNKEREPTYIIIRRNDEIIGGGVMTDTDYTSLGLRIGITFGIVNQVFLDKKKFPNKRDLHLGYIYLFDKLLKAAVYRSQGLLLYTCSKRNLELRRAVKNIGLIQFPAQVVMMKSLKPNLLIPKFKNPFFCPTHLSIGFP